MMKHVLSSAFLKRSNVSFNTAKVISTTIHLTSDHQARVYKFPESSPPADTPVITSRQLQHLRPFTQPKQAWLETLSTAEDCKLGIVNLHPDVFSVNPRLDLLHENVKWQMTYKHIDHTFERNRAEMPGGGRKPWPQKGTGRARQGSIRSPLWKGGGTTFGPRGPISHFYMLNKEKRAYGLRVALSVKYNQGDLHIVDSLDIPTDDDGYLRALVESRGWGISALFISETDYINADFAQAIDPIKEYNVMPLYGMNVFSMLKHQTLILTLPALEKLEEKLLLQMHKLEKDKRFQRHST